MKPVFASRQFAKAIVTVGILASLSNAKGDDLSLPITGELLGTVVDGAGTPEMGASVQLFNKYQRLVAKTVTNIDGRFAFASLSADTYSVRVALDSFLPAARDRILVKAGFDSVLRIHLATLLSNIEVSYRVPNAAMSDDWKWVLRSSPATRPINRYIPVELPENQSTLHPHVFSDTHAMVAVSGRDGGLIDSDEIGADMGTSFAVSTNVLGNNQLQLAGIVGQNSEFGPSAMALCAIYSRTSDSPFGAPPEITLTAAQLGGVGAQVNGGNPPNGNPTSLDGPPMLRTMSVGIYQVTDPLDNVHLEYGAVGQSVEYGQQHTSLLSPFARLTVVVGSGLSVVASYSDGGRPDELIAHQQYEQSQVDGQIDDLSAPLDSLSRLPEISNQNDRLELERTTNYEVGITKTSGSRTFSASAFDERVANGRLNVAGDLTAVDSGDLFSDGISTTSILNVGSYDRVGYLASAAQRISQSLDVEIAYGRLGGFAANSNGFAAAESGSLAFLRQTQSNLASVNLNARIPRVGTRISANYGWIDSNTVVPFHTFTTQSVSGMPGFNILVRQPLPSFGLSGHFELTADLRNLLASGYTPIDGEAHQLLIVESPRAIRGGLKFTF